MQEIIILLTFPPQIQQILAYTFVSKEDIIT